MVASQSDNESSGADDEETKANGLIDLKAFIKQINLREHWPQLQGYLRNNPYFTKPESRSVVGFARIITKEDLALVLGNSQATNTLFSELQ